VNAETDLHDGWHRPLRSGVPIAMEGGQAGTLGAIVFDRTTGQPMLLGSHHVLMSDPADPLVWQPGPCGVSGCRCNVVGRVVRGQRTAVKWRDHWYFIDAAVAVLDADVEWQQETRTDVAKAATGATVNKIGAATGTTHGIVVDAQHVDRVTLPKREIGAPNQLLVRALGGQVRFSADGDSGALVRDGEDRAVGLLWGAKGSEGVACPIGPVLDQLAVSLQPGER
jgi:hypothetical protein